MGDVPFRFSQVYTVPVRCAHMVDSNTFDAEFKVIVEKAISQFRNFTKIVANLPRSLLCDS